MSGFNSIHIVGNLGRDADMRFTASGDAIASLSVAASEHFKGRDGQPHDRTEWFTVKIFGKLAETIGPLAKKGRQVYVLGRLQSHKYTGKDGVERTAVEVIADRIQLLGSAPHADAAAADADASAHTANAGGEQASAEDPELDTIPF